MNTGLSFSASLPPAPSLHPPQPLQGSCISFYFQILSLCPLFLSLLLKLSSFPWFPLFPFLDASDVSGFPAFGFPNHHPPTQSLPPFSRLPRSPVSGRVTVQAGEMGLSIRTPGSRSLGSGGGAIPPSQFPVSPREETSRASPTRLWGETRGCEGSGWVVLGRGQKEGPGREEKWLTMDGRWEVRIPSFLEIWKTGLLSMWGVGMTIWFRAGECSERPCDPE